MKIQMKLNSQRMDKNLKRERTSHWGKECIFKQLISFWAYAILVFHLN